MRKNMKSAAAMVLVLAFIGMGITGCGGNQQSQMDTQKSVPQSAVQETRMEIITEAVESEFVETEAIKQSEERYEDNFAVDSEAAKEFAKKVKDAVAKKDLEALAELTAFPVYVGLPDVNVVDTKEDFLKLGAETVFTEELLKSIEMADIEAFQPTMAGFSITDGGTANINFGVRDKVLAINGINY